VALARGLPTTLVVYWIHEAGSYAWVVGEDGAVNAARIEMPAAALRRAVRRAVDETPDASLTVSGTDRTIASAAAPTEYRALYRALWRPLERWLPRESDARITVLPHGPLFTLPFAALVDHRGRYLIERFALHYAASGAVLSEAAARARQQPVADATALLVADPSPIAATERGLQLPGLNAARGEVRSIAALVNGRAVLLMGARASEAAVRDALPRARLVHFATHGLVRDSDPLGSHLMLATAGGRAYRASHDDGRLTASEIAHLRLSSDLVVLGACRSARGAVSSDGISGLTRAFMAAGAPSVIATLWDVPDTATSRLMERFYRLYLAGVSKDRALRAAQLALLRDLRAGRVKVRVGHTTIASPEHPHFWAGAILVGAP
jgi:CHAT domain-containing protein